MEDWYSVLGVSKTASQDEIKSAYRKLAKSCHPDMHPGDKAAEEKFKKISAAYDVLGDENKRRNYDNGGWSSYGSQSSYGEGNPYGQNPYGQWENPFGQNDPFEHFRNTGKTYYYQWHDPKTDYTKWDWLYYALKNGLIVFISWEALKYLWWLFPLPVFALLGLVIGFKGLIRGVREVFAPRRR